MTEPVEPPEGLGSSNGDSWQSHTEVHTVDKITVTADGASAASLQIYYLCRPDCILSDHGGLLDLSHPLSFSLCSVVSSLA